MKARSKSEKADPQRHRIERETRPEIANETPLAKKDRGLLRPWSAGVLIEETQDPVGVLGVRSGV